VLRTINIREIRRAKLEIELLMDILFKLLCSRWILNQSKSSPLIRRNYTLRRRLLNKANAKLSYPDQALNSGVMWMERKSGREKVTRGG